MDSNEKERLERVNRQFTLMRNYRSDFERSWQIAEDTIWINIREQKGVSSESRTEKQVIRFPIAYSVLMQMLSDFFDNIPKAHFVCVDEKERWKFEAFRKVWDYVLNKADYTTNITYAFIDMFVKGVGCIETDYIEKYRTVYLPDYIKVDNQYIKESKRGKSVELLEVDTPVMLYRDPKTVWVDPNATDVYSPNRVNDAKYGVLLDEYDYYTFKNKFKKEYGFKNINKVLPANRNYFFDVNAYNNEREDTREVGYSDRVYILRYQDTERDEEIIYANGIEIAYRALPMHKRLTFDIIKFHPYPNNLYCFGLGELLQGMSKEINVLLNLDIFQRKMALQPHVFVSSRNINVEDFVIRPQGVTQLPLGSNIKEELQIFQPPILQGLTQDLKNTIDDYITQSTGQDVRALFGNTQEKAFQTAIKREITNKRNNLMVKTNETRALKNVFEQTISNMFEFYLRKKPKLELKYKNGIPTYVMTNDYPKVIIQNFEVKEEDNKISFEAKKGATAKFNATPDLVQTEISVEVGEGSLSVSLQELERQRWLEMITAIFPILSSNPELMKRIDIYQLVKTTVLKFNENLSDVFKDKDSDENQEDNEKKELDRLLKLTQSEEFKELAPAQQKEIMSRITVLMQSKVQSDVMPNTGEDSLVNAANAQSPITGGGIGAGVKPNIDDTMSKSDASPKSMGKNPVAQFAGKVSQILR